MTRNARWLRFAVLSIVALIVFAALPNRRALAIARVSVTFKEWMTPSKPAYPHDPAYSPIDASVWYTGQRANVIGRLDPQTGTFKEYPLPTPDSGPHGLVVDKDGNVWYTGNSAGLVGKLDPKTGKVVEYKMPDPRARDPHTGVFDLDGKYYFTVQGGNFVGRIDPATGQVTLKQPPTVTGRPYGIVRAASGKFYFDEFNSNRIGELDPKAMTIKEYVIPAAGARPRRITMGKDDTVYYTDYARGVLGHLDPASGKVDEFKSPGGPGSQPYAIATTPDGTIWYCETAADDKNMLVRFDPSSKAMQSWRIPTGGTVRHMVVGKPNELWLAESGAGKIARALIE
jgi:virginiamycin B lyase